MSPAPRWVRQVQLVEVAGDGSVKRYAMSSVVPRFPDLAYSGDNADINRYVLPRLPPHERYWVFDWEVMFPWQSSPAPPYGHSILGLVGPTGVFSHLGASTWLTYGGPDHIGNTGFTLKATSGPLGPVVGSIDGVALVCRYPDSFNAHAPFLWSMRYAIGPTPVAQLLDDDDPEEVALGE